MGRTGHNLAVSTLKDLSPFVDFGERDGGPKLPGLLATWSGGRACCVPFPLADGAVAIGRDELLAAGIDDGHVSRRHLHVELRDHRWHVRDSSSTNGSTVDRQPVVKMLVGEPRVVRIGRTLLLFSSDLRAISHHGVLVEPGLVAGPRLQALRTRVQQLATAGQSLLLTGETGVGKEVMANAFHRATGRPRGPFVAVNCAAIPPELAERLIFGARRGAFSGAIDSDGYLRAACGGTLFLDELGDLEVGLQAKLLRAIESREVLPLGATRATPLDIRVCAATHRDLRNEVSRGTFRRDLYFRMGRPEVQVPPLRARPEEIAWLIQEAVGAIQDGKGLAITPSFVEACLLRSWPGNVRELWSEVRACAIAAVGDGRQDLGVDLLDDVAGAHMAEESSRSLDPEVAREVLASEQGNLSRAARRLGVPRTTLRRVLQRHGIDLHATDSKDKKP